MKEESEDKSTADNTFSTTLKTKDGRKWNFKISAWNVAGIRAWMKKKDSLEYIKNENPDVLVVTEVKCSVDEMSDDIKNLPGYQSYFQKATAGKKGYAGVGFYSKIKPINVTFGIGE